MHDGRFRDGESAYSLGRCVLVFAGSTSYTFEAFQARALSRDPVITRAKARDFLSRLRGHVNVLGPGAASRGEQSPGDADPLHVIRRALILRSALEKKAPGIFVGARATIDERVLERLLSEDYAHGARSIEAILEMSQLAGKTAFGPADLPPEDQLTLHINRAEPGEA
jgi:hypothetical protein